MYKRQLYASEDDPACRDRGFYDHGQYPFVLDAQKAMAPGAPHLHPGGNLCQSRHVRRGDAAQALRNSRYVVTRTYETPFTEHAFLEPECAVALPYGDGVKVYTSDQSVYDTRKEIAIMRLVGASNGFIRGPFLAEGALHALIGALLAIFVLEIARNLVLPQMAVALPWLPIGVDFGMFLLIYLAMLVAGLVIGLLGSLFAMSRYLKV